MDLLALARNLIAADTVSHKGTSAAVDVLAPLYRDAGLVVTVQEQVRDGVRHQNLFGEYPGAEASGLLLVTHLDTVDPGPLELWTESPPHTLTRKDDKLYGLGSADTKLDSLCKWMAAREFRGRKLKRSLQLLGTFEEEVGCKGAKHFLRSPQFTAKFVACSEPSELTIIRAHKGYAVVVVSVELAQAPTVQGPFEQTVYDGKAAHSSTPHLGINAIEKALADLRPGTVSFEAGSVSNKVPARATVIRHNAGSGPAVNPPQREDGHATLLLGQALFEAWKRRALAQTPERNDAFDPATCVVNFGVARVTGRKGEFTFDCRLLPGHDPEALTQGFVTEAETMARAAGATLSVRVDRASHAMELKEPSELLQAARESCRELKLNDVPQAKPTNTEAGVFASTGAEAIVFGPGRSTGNAHCANEHNQYSQLLKAVEFYRALITRLCT